MPAKPPENRVARQIADGRKLARLMRNSMRSSPQRFVGRLLKISLEAGGREGEAPENIVNSQSRVASGKPEEYGRTQCRINVLREESVKVRDVLRQGLPGER
jgi:hypothetical protein